MTGQGVIIQPIGSRLKSIAIENRKSGRVKAMPVSRQAALFVDLALARERFSVFGLAAQFERLETRRRHGATDLGLRDNRGHIADARLFGGKSHLGCEYTVQLEQAFSSLRASLSSARRLMERSAWPLAMP